MSKPIEPGCIAILVSAERRFDQIGMSFTVISEVKVASRVHGEPCWLLDDGEWVLGRQLLRIDGDEHVSTEQREEVEA